MLPEPDSLQGCRSLETCNRIFALIDRTVRGIDPPFCACYTFFDGLEENISTMRVIAGSAKGHKLFSVPGEGTRPILDRVKEALFNILGPAVAGSVFLDLFAGTGSVGIEALSRGAHEAIFVDTSRKAIAVIERNLAKTKLEDKGQLFHEDAFHLLHRAPERGAFHYVYVAPPQYQRLWIRALKALDEKSGLLAKDGIIIVQIDPKEAEPLELRNLNLYDEREYGNTLLQFYRLQIEAEREEGL